ncbi:hypothetical protein C8Q72DRAFT_108009 [Fomitopsis betulina]|nr:hypothetical protein C8Q72DRAFT_108009 [Fomitopsis betulina]
MCRALSSIWLNALPALAIASCIRSATWPTGSTDVKGPVAHAVCSPPSVIASTWYSEKQYNAPRFTAKSHQRRHPEWPCALERAAIVGARNGAAGIQLTAAPRVLVVG